MCIRDRDITGTSIPKAFGIHGRAVAPGDAIVPVTTATGLQLLSVNLLLEHETDPVIWRGPVIGGVVQQFWGDTLWNLSLIHISGFGCSRLSWGDGRCVQGPGTYSPRHADPRLLAIPASRGRVAAHYLNWDGF